MHSHLIKPHGGELTDIMAPPEEAEELKRKSQDWPSWDLTEKQLCDLELLMNGAFSPLKGFLGQKDYESVCAEMRLSDGTIWPMPVQLDITRELAEQLGTGDMLALRDPEGVMLAALEVTEIWEPEFEREAETVMGTTNPEHPGVAHLLNDTNPCYISGKLTGIQPPRYFDFQEHRMAPGEVRKHLAELGWHKVVAFQTRNPMHRVHFELTYRACQQLEANLLIQPVVGKTKPGDVDHFTRVRCYQAVLHHYPRNMALLSLLPLAMRMGGPREALWHALIRKNYGCTHFIVGRDHAGPGSDSCGNPFYGPYEAQELLKKHQDEIEIEMVPFRMLGYDPETDTYVPVDEAPEDKEIKVLSGTELRKRLNTGREIPEWFSFPEVITELRRTYPPRDKQGFTVFFTGLPSSGKSTIANGVMVKLMEMGGRPVTLLDGDIVRKNLSSELGFSKKDRDINIRRIGFVASEITKNGGVAICAPIAPYHRVRKEIRELIEPLGGFILVHVDAPVEVCEKRDRKGLYAKARAGIVKNFTGISDPYEEPEDAEIKLDTVEFNPEECVQETLLYLEREGYIGPQ
jgi:sulfate adenylyltransferase